MSIRIPALLLAALALTGCHSYKDDLVTICNAERLSGADSNGGFAATASYLAEHIHTRQGRELMRSIATTGGTDQLRAEVDAQGIKPCPILEKR